MTFSSMSIGVGRLETSTVVRVGRVAGSGNASVQSRFRVPKSSAMWVRKQVTSTMSDHSAPAAVSTARTLAKTARVCASKSRAMTAPVASWVTPGMVARASFARPDAGQEEEVADPAGMRVRPDRLGGIAR